MFDKLETIQDIAAILHQTDVDIIYSLNNTNNHSKEEFMEDGRLIRPKNAYGHLELDTIEKNLSVLLQLKKDIGLYNIDDKFKMLFTYIIDYNENKNRFLLSNYRVNDKVTHNMDYSKEAEEHKVYNEILYGEINPRVFWAIFGKKIKQIRNRSLSIEEKSMYEELNHMIGYNSLTEDTPYEPDLKTIDEFSMLMREFYSDILKEIPTDNREYSVLEVCDLTNSIINKFCNGYGWKAVVEPGRAIAAASYKDKAILYPGKRSRGNYSREELVSIIMHEFGVHVMRSVAYDDCMITAFASGFSDYESFEEGVAKAVEQAIIGKYKPSGYLHYISIGLASICRKNFREVYEIQKRLEKLTDGVSDGQCFDSVQRAFRGTGILVNNKDLVYYNGSEVVWKFIQDNLDSPCYLLQQLFLSGKTDSTNDLHRRFVYEMKVGGFN